AETARQLGLSEDAVRRGQAIGNLCDEAKEAARQTGQADNQSALLAAAKESTPEAQVRVVQDRAARKARCARDSAMSAAVVGRYRGSRSSSGLTTGRRIENGGPFPRALRCARIEKVHFVADRLFFGSLYHGRRRRYQQRTKMSELARQPD